MCPSSQNIHILLLKAFFLGMADTVFNTSQAVEKIRPRSCTPWLQALEQRQPLLSPAALAMWAEVPPALRSDALWL